MNIILLSGGSGKRLWPLSNDIRSKQFIKIFSSSYGKQESMVQRVYRQIKSLDPNIRITIATSKTQVSAIRNQIDDSVEISVEPCRRDTFPAIALASSFLVDIQKVDKDEVVVVCPIDPYVEEDYFNALLKLEEIAAKGNANLALMGIEPTYPSEKYGYIIPVTDSLVSKVSTFKEKPDIATAESYINQGALWNSGVFAYRLSYVLEKSKELLGTSSYEELYENYENLEKNSFDYAVVEKERNICVLRFGGAWKDIGTWNTLTEAMDCSVIGNGRIDDTSSNVHILNELDIPILSMGMKDVVVSASPEGILVSDLEQSSFIKPYVDEIKMPVMFAEKSWGTYKVIDIEKESLTIKITLNPGESMNYHSHERRDEVWTVISGLGMTVVDGMEQEIKAGDVITMARGCRHTILNTTDKPLKLVEIQLGKDISVRDKYKYDMP